MIYRVLFEFIRLIIRILVTIVSFINYQTFFDNDLIHVFVFKYICVNSFLLLWSYVIFDENFEDWSNSKIMKKMLYFNKSVEIKSFRKNIRFAIREIDFFSVSNAWNHFFLNRMKLFAMLNRRKKFCDCYFDMSEYLSRIIAKIIVQIFKEYCEDWLKKLKCADEKWKNVK